VGDLLALLHCKFNRNVSLGSIDLFAGTDGAVDDAGVAGLLLQLQLWVFFVVVAAAVLFFLVVVGVEGGFVFDVVVLELVERFPVGE
jgi:hypothetical protein